jgi:hypothetical protein
MKRATISRLGQARIGIPLTIEQADWRVMNQHGKGEGTPHPAREAA